VLTSNKKLGNGVVSFSIPAIDTCPGSSKLCERVCYASRGGYAYPSVKNHLERMRKLARSPEFVDAMVLHIRNTNSSVIRIHSSGDFDTVEYIRRWTKIVRRVPNVTFYAYTRSWRIKRLRKDLYTLSKQPNMLLWFSTDKELHQRFGRPPRWKTTRVAYMQCDYDEVIPGYADLVFRIKRKTAVKYVQGKLVCPAENGIHGKVKQQCTNCRLCFTDRPIPTK